VVFFVSRRAELDGRHSLPRARKNCESGGIYLHHSQIQQLFVSNTPVIRAKFGASNNSRNTIVHVGHGVSRIDFHKGIRLLDSWALLSSRRFRMLQ
jgi:hypothetical protein